jgi:hypothetical protein
MSVTIGIEQLESRRLFAATFEAGVLGTVPLRDIVDGPRPIVSQFSINLSATVVSPIRIDLNWTISGIGAPSAFTIERAAGDSQFTAIATVASTQRTFQSTNLNSDTMYRYRVRMTTVVSNTTSAKTQKYDAGLNAAFQFPSPTTGRTLNILNFGATSNNSSNDDTTAIKNAISAAVAGDEIYIPNGTYHLKTRDIALKTGVSIRGQSQGGAILSALFNDAGTDNPSSEMFHANQGVNNLTLSNFSINLAGGQSMEYGFYIGSGSDGATNCSRIALKQITVEGFEKMAVAVRHSDNILVQACAFKNATALGGGGEGYGVMLGYNTTANCWVTQNTFGPVLRHGVVVQYFAHHNLIENNVADATTLDSFDLHGEDEYSNELRYNLVKNVSGGDGFGVGNTGSTHHASGSFNWIHHNEVFNSRGGINVILGSSNEYIEDNYFHDNDSYGVRVYNGGGSNLFFLRNTILRSGTGMTLSEAPGVWIEGNTVSNNTGAALVTDALTTGYTIINNDFRTNGAAVSLGSSDGIFRDNLLP